MRATCKTLYHAWMRLAEFLGTLNAWLILTVLYFSLVMPFGILARLLTDPLRLRRRRATPYWIPRAEKVVSLEDMKRPF